MRALTALFLILLTVSIATAQRKGEVIAEKANLRGTPNVSGKVIVEVSQGAKFETIKEAKPWYLVQTAEYVGWIHGNTIALDTDSPNYSGIDLRALSRPEPAPKVRKTYTPRPFTPPSTTRTAADGHTYMKGPKGGCYYLNSSGKKTYVDKGFCN